MAQSDVDIPPAAYGMAFPLAVVGGYVDAVGFLTLAGLFVAHMSGNTVRLGVFVGDGDWSLAAQRLVPIIVFTIGVMGGIALVEVLRRRSAPAPAARVLAVETLLLLAFMLVGRAVLDGTSATGGSWDYYLLAILAVLAMGWQNAALRRVAGVPLHTTFVTGILTHLAEETVNGVYAWRDLRRAGGARTGEDTVSVAFRRARLHGGVWASYLGGGVLGAFVALRWDLWSLTLPLAVLVALIAVDLSRHAARP
ncbi:MAG TPA: YoaK family protein [Acidimicrobiia bacterium]|nr:YoaK family protein [Acidimicrobiia bacterium]